MSRRFESMSERSETSERAPLRERADTGLL